ncbi:MAG: AmmeMemoRadiSam system protein A [Desulfobulbia bacterium]
MAVGKTQELSLEKGRRLLQLVRETIGHHLGMVDGIDLEDIQDPLLLKPCGTFVTLKYHNNLRGCIGNLEPSESMVESLRKNALNAAFHDHRFSPLTPAEYDTVVLEISILSQPELLEYVDAADLLNRLRPGIDGVILQAGGSRATFLPQVWSQLPEPELFLTHLSQKAGLDGQAWRTHHPDIFCYQVQSFTEKTI